MAREWIRRGYEVHVFCSTHSRTMVDWQEHVDAKRLVLHPLVNANRLLLSHAFDPQLHEVSATLIAELAPESIHIHNFHGMLGAVQAAVESGYKTVYTALDFGLICHSWYLYDGSLAPCTGPEAQKCRECLSSQQPVPWLRRFVGSWPSWLLSAMGKNADYFKQFPMLPGYYAQTGGHLRYMLPLLKRFDRVLTISPVFGRILSEFGVDPKKIHFSVQGADFPSPAAAKVADGIRLVFLGHMAPIKGFQVIAEAAARLPDGLKLEIRTYGTDAERYVSGLSPEAKRYIKAFKTLVGAEVDRELSEADALVIPSLWRENTPYAVLRALAAGRPVLGSDQEGISHLIQDQKNGFLLPTGDVQAWKNILHKAALDPLLLRNLRPNCSYKKSVQTYADEVEQAMSK